MDVDAIPLGANFSKVLHEEVAKCGVLLAMIGDLTPRESQMLSLLAKGKTYSSIAEELGVSYKTVVNACLYLKRKLGAKNLPELIGVAVRLIPAEA